MPGKIKDLFVGSSSAKDADTSTELLENTPPREMDSSTASISATGSTSSDVPEFTPAGKMEKEEKKKVPVDNTITLTINVRFTTIAPMTISEKQESRKQ